MNTVPSFFSETFKNIEIYHNQPRSFYIEEAVRLKQGELSNHGSLLVSTGKHTGRSANDRYIVKDAGTAEKVWWENNLNAMTPEIFASLKAEVTKHLQEADQLYSTSRTLGAQEEYSMRVDVITRRPSHALFTQHMFREPTEKTPMGTFTILHAPDLKLDPAKFDLKSPVAIATCFETNTTLVIGSLYAGEIKKSMFSVFNYLLPDMGVMPMHTGASELPNKETALFFGLSGTGKTTLSTDEGTILIGDDEHGMSEKGIFNFEGGCYAKTIKLSPKTEPGIYKAVNTFGAMIENVKYDSTSREIDFFDDSITENGRASYPLSFIDDLEETGSGVLPKNIFFLTADAFGVLPPVAKLTAQQSMFYFSLGYTAKLAGTEIGVAEPTATFSPCFGAPFMLRKPNVYAELLGNFINKHNINVWLVNTGWTGGAYGTGERFPLSTTRQIIRQVQRGGLESAQFENDPIFNLAIPMEVQGVDNDMLSPIKTWSDQAAYTTKAQELATAFHAEMKKHGDFYQTNIEGSPTFGR